jgi:YfiH family protein
MTALPSTTVVRVAALADGTHARHGFFTRNASVGETHGEANCAYRTPEETARVTAARARCTAAVQAQILVTVKQRHTADVVVVDEPWSWDAAPIADALVSRRTAIALGILTADCAPVLLADENAGIVAAAHAGWRGAFDGVIANTVAAMTKLGASPARIVAGIGPCIGPASYEVGPEFRAQFVARDPGFGSYFDDSRAKPHFNLPAFVADRLRAAGVGTVAIQGGDTVAEEALYFSYRRSTLRGEPDYGRQLSAISQVDRA